MSSYDSWKTDYDGWLESQEVRSRCEVCGRLRYGCQDADLVDDHLGDGTWHICPQCLDRFNAGEQLSPFDPDDLRESRQDRQ